MSDEEIIDLINAVSLQTLVPVKEIGKVIKTLYNRMTDFLNSGEELTEDDFVNMFNNLY